MNGREFFGRFGFIVRKISILLSVFPEGFVSFIVACFSSFGGRWASLLRYVLLSGRFESCGSNVYLGPGLTLKGLSRLVVGDNVSIHDYSYLDAQGGLTIGDNVSIAHHVSILTFNHTWSDLERPIKYNPVVTEGVVIESDVWIGCGVRIMPGVIIGRRSVIAAGAVVTKNIPSGVIVAGVPARVIKLISDEAR
ncbi:acyltransferase [Ectopseudomonas mendocina]|uniref:Acyltransferase n=1 Tax=Ectopseudomonas mendocina TaxID=300 RepID=A0ABD7RR48_ECTME|nr:acyltransferase [Pseudomonas mendocina]TRO10077.1 acyltransferase [Pseudomonas mendocina]TRO12145.1 acyltransferase [Pseudomonas mendocina]